MGRDWYWGSGGNGRSSKSKRDANKTTAFGSNGDGDGQRSSSTSRSKKCAKTTASVKKNNDEKRSSVMMMKEGNSTVSGCMSAMFHLFDSHHFHFHMNTHHHHDSSSPHDDDDDDIPLPKGVEAPRNSLESTPTRKEENLNFSMGMQIKTKPARTKQDQALNATTPTESYSPSTKSPNLVARLMGLDLVPDKSLRSSISSSSTSPCNSSAALSVDLGTPNLRRSKPHHTATTLKHHHHYSLHRNSVDGSFTAGTRSLPETPRISLGRRSDVGYYNYQQHRLSLHINRDNVAEQEPGAARFASSRLKEMKMNEDNNNNNKENRSPREYARQIVMQLKENIVSRRVGADITNITRNKEQTTEHHQHKNHDSKKTSKILTSDSLPTPSFSPKLRILENPKSKSASQRPQPTDPQANIVKIFDEPHKEQVQGRERRGREGQKQRKTLVNKFKRPENEMKFCSRMVKPPQTMQEEPFVRVPEAGNISSAGGGLHQGDRKCKKTLLSNDLLNFNTTLPSLIPVKKKDYPSTEKPSNLYVDALKVTEAQAPRGSYSRLHSCTSQNQRRNVRREITTSTTSAAELDYITRILRRTGVDRDTPISYVKWFSPSHPLDPAIFYFLEHFAVTSGRSNGSSPGNLSLRCNRKLLFHLVDEILVRVLKPHMSMKPWVCHYPRHRSQNYLGSELIDDLCERIGRFPLADCRVLEDIDTLVARDLSETTEVQRDLTAAFEEEGEGIVTELERDILETLVSETASDCYVMGTETVPFCGKLSVSCGTYT